MDIGCGTIIDDSDADYLMFPLDSRFCSDSNLRSTGMFNDFVLFFLCLREWLPLYAHAKNFLGGNRKRDRDGLQIAVNARFKERNVVG